MADRFYIGLLDNNASLQTSLKPFAIPDNAFSRLNNAYIFRGRVKKRFGSRFMRGTDPTISGFEQIQSRLKVKITTPIISGNTYNINTLLSISGNIAAVGQAFSVGSIFLTSSEISGDMLTTNSVSLIATYDTTTGDFVFTGTISGDIYFFPSLPVMGLVTYERPTVNVEDVVGFDTQFAYQFSANGWERLGTAVWTGTNADFFWGFNAPGTTFNQTFLYVTNYNIVAPYDPMYYYNGSNWISFTPLYDSSDAANNYIKTARIIVYFKGRLLLLNTLEYVNGVATLFQNRCRYSWLQSPVDVNAFDDVVSGRGDSIDAATQEAIITAQFLKDRLIVYFESSTWEIAYTGNDALPFKWQKINTELGAESTFSQVPFDKIVLGVGNVGIHACNGVNVERIDDKIPDAVFEIHNDNNGIERVAGIRDYFTEAVYWTFPDEDRSTDYPFNNKILVYNYKTGSWAFNDDSITAFGYFQTTVSNNTSDLTWGQATMTWQEANFAWRAPILQAKFRNVIAGNQQGYTFIVDAELSFNAPALQITDISYISQFTNTLTVINHNLSVDDYVKVTNAQGITSLNGNIYQVSSRTVNTVTFNNSDVVGGMYTGGGNLTRVTPIDILTKQYNFYANQGRNALISEVDFLVDRTTNGEFTVDFLVSSCETGIVDNAIATGSLVGTSVLETKPYTLTPYEAQQERLWHPLYMWADGEYVQLRFYLTDNQIRDSNISESEFELHSMVFYAKPTSSRLQ